ncbi:hypothetical protein ABH945_003715 [Paraburkholderia sp. GAS333]|uniref:hypothetical protein n=1 Tax=Paraburkholderia sp. GAS333 TaxID=3156279 RepID=UPI003D1C7F64
MNDMTSTAAEVRLEEDAKSAQTPDTRDVSRAKPGWIVITLLSLYLLLYLAGAAAAILSMCLGDLEGRWAALRVGLMCAAVGAVGGCLYCLRAVYLNRCVRKTWTNEWAAWYLIRPIVSTCCGGISFLFLKAGLLVLESGTKSDASEIGFYALALVAGLNVDKFVAKIEDVAQAVWGIDQSRTRKDASPTEKPAKRQAGAPEADAAGPSESSAVTGGSPSAE